MNSNIIQAVKTLVYTDDNDVNGQDNDGQTPLHFASEFDKVGIVECFTVSVCKYKYH
jgi:ankyrin repeat protein